MASFQWQEQNTPCDPSSGIPHIPSFTINSLVLFLGVLCVLVMSVSENSLVPPTTPVTSFKDRLQQRCRVPNSNEFRTHLKYSHTSPKFPFVFVPSKLLTDHGLLHFMWLVILPFYPWLQWNFQKEAENEMVMGRLSYERNHHQENHKESKPMLCKFAWQIIIFIFFLYKLLRLSFTLLLQVCWLNFTFFLAWQPFLCIDQYAIHNKLCWILGLSPYNTDKEQHRWNFKLFE